jgi:hypothetical protein
VEHDRIAALSPTSLAIFLTTTSAALYKDGACVRTSRIHGAGNPGTVEQHTGDDGVTWMEASYEPAPIRPITPDSPYTQGHPVLSHEIAEWADDPYALNLASPRAAVRPDTSPAQTC